MKQVWMLNHYAHSPDEPGITRHFYLAKYLADNGWHATIIAASVEHPRGVQRLQDGEAQRLDIIHEVPYQWVRTPGYEGNGGGRMLNMLTYTWRVLLKRTTQKLPPPDVVIGSSAHPFAAMAGAILAKRYKVPFVFEVRDLWPQTLIDFGRLREGALMTKFLRKLELWLYRRAARTVVLLPHAWKYIVPLGVPKEHVIWIPNGVDLSLFPKPKLAAPNEHDPFSLMYFGTHGEANGLDNALRAMKLVQERQHADPNTRKVHLRLIGDGPLKATLIEQSRQLQLNNVSFEDPVPKSQIPQLAGQADAFIFTLADAAVFKYGISPNKLFDFLAAARPVIFCCDASNDPVADASAGFTVKPAQPELLADAIIKLSRLPIEDRQRMGASGREYVEMNHGVDKTAGRLARMLNDITN